jgi:hypothetical protein
LAIGNLIFRSSVPLPAGQRLSGVQLRPKGRPCASRSAVSPCSSLTFNEAEIPPFILPLNWNFRPAWHRSWWGPIKIWHDYNPPPQAIVDFSRQQAKPDSIIQFMRFQ